MIFTCIIVDDDQFALNQLIEYISLIPSLILIKAYKKPLVALKEILKREEPIDFLFTDIEMPEISGLELAKQINQKVSRLVLVSAHTKNAIEGYNVDARHFLSKPFGFQKFQSIIDQLMRSFLLEEEFIWIKSGIKSETLKIFITSIIAVQAASNYIQIHTHEKTYLQYGKISDMEKHLKKFNRFKRISRSFIISVNHIKKYDGNNVYLSNNIVVNIALSYKPEIKSFLTSLTKNNY
ncbi:LytTR family DNA-binding domain-containing protein [Pedobacter nototheniae]|uniref:LytR/AlgR family response regulator transcription factor n=1 Tax=Pedobacter nototheniae TaxID=2488994 RepID=UPI0029318CFD|nr:LytTR family DNA-binding domain-containing protein [Pedobacter nototheniae]